MEVRDKVYIGGAWVPSTGQGTLEVVDSNTEEVMATIPEGTAEDVDRAVGAAADAFAGWSATSVEERAKMLCAHLRGPGGPDRRDRPDHLPAKWACR